MAELIAKIVFIFSLLGMGGIILKKFPLLVRLPERSAKLALPNFLARLKEKVKFLNPFRYFSPEIFLQKILSKIRISALRTERKIGDWLQKLRERGKKKLEDDNYWQELKKAKDQKEKKI